MVPKIRFVEHVMSILCPDVFSPSRILQTTAAQIPSKHGRTATDAAQLCTLKYSEHTAQHSHAAQLIAYSREVPHTHTTHQGVVNQAAGDNSKHKHD